jgi:hypothetical protein
LSRFKEMLENNEKDDKNYDGYKNIWLSTTLAVNIISSICDCRRMKKS